MRRAVSPVLTPRCAAPKTTPPLSDAAPHPHLFGLAAAQAAAAAKLGDTTSWLYIDPTGLTLVDQVPPFVVFHVSIADRRQPMARITHGESPGADSDPRSPTDPQPPIRARGVNTAVAARPPLEWGGRS